MSRAEFDDRMKPPLLWRRKNQTDPVTGKAPIVLRISIDGFDMPANLTTNVTATEEEWPVGSRQLQYPDKAKKDERQAIDQANSKLAILKGKVQRAYDLLCDQGSNPSPADVKAVLRPRKAGSKKVPTFLALLVAFWEHSNRPEAKKALNTLTTYKARLKTLRVYAEKELKQPRLLAKEVDLPWARRFERWCVDHGHGSASAHKQVNMLQMVLAFAANEGLIPHYPLHGYKFQAVISPPKKRHLSELELKAMSAAVFPDETLAAICDLWVFCAYTGLSLVDYKRFALAPDEFLRVHDSVLGIQMVRQKTKRVKPGGFWVPLLPEALSIFERRRRCLPIRTDPFINRKLKTLAAVLGLSLSDLTHKDARSTFSQMMRDRGFSDEAVASMMGDTIQVMNHSYSSISAVRIIKEVSVLGLALGDN